MQTAELFRSRTYHGRGRWRYRIRAGNGEIVAASQAYFSKWNAKRAALKNHPTVVRVVTVPEEEA